MSLEVELLLRIVVAALFGALLGFDRQRRNKPAGLRTHVLVAVGSALAAVTGILYLGGLGDEAAARADLLRVVMAVLTGIGFLGAGTIIQERGHVQGITTAAGIWVTAAVGVAVGFGYLLPALVTTVVAVLVVAVLPIGEERLVDRVTGRRTDGRRSPGGGWEKPEDQPPD